jgi:hypothetical protein
MEVNIGVTDRLVRFALGIVLLGLGGAALAGMFGLGTAVGGGALVVGAILVGTAAIRMCPLYRLIGVDTCPAQSR